jgi:hypothetical protein
MYHQRRFDLVTRDRPSSFQLGASSGRCVCGERKQRQPSGRYIVLWQTAQLVAAAAAFNSAFTHATKSSAQGTLSSACYCLLLPPMNVGSMLGYADLPGAVGGGRKACGADDGAAGGGGAEEAD